MASLLKFELYKLSKMKSFWGCLIATVIVAVISVFLFYGILGIVSGALLEAAGGYADDLDALKDMNVLDYGIIAIAGVQFLAIMSSVVITNMIARDFEMGAMRNVIAKSYSRTSVYMSKQIVAWLIQFVYLFVFVGACMAVAAILFRGPILPGTVSKFVWAMICELLLYMASTTIYVAVTFVIRNGGGSIAINIGIILLISIVLTLFDLIVSGGEGIFFRSLWVFSAIEQTADLEIKNALIIKDIINSILLTGVCIGIGNFAFKKRDMK